jgi:hypothetical protein
VFFPISLHTGQLFFARNGYINETKGCNFDRPRRLESQGYTVLTEKEAKYAIIQ